MTFEIFKITEKERQEIILENIKMGIADATVQGQANAYAINDNKVTISLELVIILLIIIILLGLWKFLQNYIKKHTAINAVRN